MGVTSQLVESVGFKFNQTEIANYYFDYDDGKSIHIYIIQLACPLLGTTTVSAARTLIICTVDAFYCRSPPVHNFVNGSAW